MTSERVSDHGISVIRIADPARGIEVLIAPSVGNRAYSMKVCGANILHMPAADISQLRELSGIPFLAPWANRIPGGGFHANGKWYTFNESLGVLRMHPDHVAIHGMLTASNLWSVTSLGADAGGAWVTSRLEFWRYPDLMANWPFAHEYEMTYRLAEGALDVSVSVRNLGAEPMPLVVGFHPYFKMPGVPRESCTARIPARFRVAVDDHLCATGEMLPNSLPDPVPLADYRLDDGFTGLTRNTEGIAEFVLAGAGKQIEVKFGPKWQVGIVYAPAGHDYICFEPMAGITNAVNLGAEGKYPDLHFVAPGDVWNESFSVRTVNFPNIIDFNFDS